jgi:hypothetical protein
MCINSWSIINALYDQSESLCLASRVALTGKNTGHAILEAESNLNQLGYRPLPIHTSDNAVKAGGSFDLAVILILNDNYEQPPIQWALKNFFFFFLGGAQSSKTQR